MRSKCKQDVCDTVEVYVAANAADEAKYQEGLGRCVVRIPTGKKGPRDKGWSKSLELPEDLAAYFNDGHQNIGVLLGEPSGWLVDVDLDCPEAVELADQYLPPTDCVTGREGRPRSHRWYISEGAEACKLSDPADGSTIVELRSTNLQTVIGPSTHPDGGQYDLLRGEPASVPHEELREAVEALHDAVCVLRDHDVEDEPNESVALPTASPVLAMGIRPGDDYNQRGDLHALLLSHGWRVTGKGHDGNIQLTRPGKSSGISATFKDGVFYLFSSSVPGFEPDRGYSPFEVYTRLEHGGDHTAAASALAADGFGSSEAVDYGVDFEALLAKAGTGTDGASLANGPGFEVRDWSPDESGANGGTSTDSFPEHLLKVPGFIGEYVKYTLDTAYARQPVVSLFGGVCLQAALSARKLTDPFGNQTSLYVVCLVGSGKGKDRPRKVNREILDTIGSRLEGPEDLASDAGLLSVLNESPASLLQLDEMGRLLKAARAAGEKSAHLFNINTLLLRLYSSVGSIYKGKAYGDKRKNVEVYMPCPVIYGSTVPESFWGAMSADSISDGFLARLIPVVGTEEPEYATPASKPVPQRLLDHARNWDRRTCGSGNLAAQHPSPFVADYLPEALELMRAKSVEWRQRGDKSGEWQPVWVRAAEKAARLALVYAASRSSESPQIDAEAYQWASDVIEWSTELYESMGTHKIADSEFERKCSRVYDAIAKRDDYLTNRELLWHRSYKSLSQRERGEVMGVLVADGRVESCESSIGSLAWRAVGR
jgi:hypothetical protein